jgi:hypothetical protein
MALNGTLHDCKPFKNRSASPKERFPYGCILKTGGRSHDILDPSESVKGERII